MARKRDEESLALIDKLISWASNNRLSKDPYISLLVNSLSSGKNLHILADLDPMQYLPRPNISGNTKRERKLRLVTVIRNVLVFTPVALTWAAVNVSTSAFSNYVKDNSLSVTNFLDFWQNGYGYLPSHWRISQVALLDFFLILAVIMLTVYISILSIRQQSIFRKLQSKMEEERSALALEIQLVLHDKKKITALNMSQSVAGSISRLVVATKNLETASKLINKSINKAVRD